MIPYRAKMVRFKTAMMRFKVCENDSFTRPPSMFYKYRRKNIMTEYIQAYVSSSVKQPFTNCFFSHGLPVRYVVYGYVQCTLSLTTTTNFTVVVTARHTRCTQTFLVTTRCPRRLWTLGDVKSFSPIPIFIQDLTILMPCTLLFQMTFRACLNRLDQLKSRTTLIVDYK